MTLFMITWTAQLWICSTLCDVTFSNVEQLEKQEGDVDCGVFSIAIATSLLHGLTPTQYNQSLMRHHLVHSLEAKTIQPFP